MLKSIPLFRNPIIQLEGAALSDKRWEKFPAKGVCRVTDITFGDHLGTWDEFTQYYPTLKIKKGEYESLLEAIPIQIKEALRNDPPMPTAGTHWGHMVGEETKVLMILDNGRALETSYRGMVQVDQKEEDVELDT